MWPCYLFREGLRPKRAGLKNLKIFSVLASDRFENSSPKRASLPPGLYARRIIGGDRHHRNSGGAAPARPGARKRERSPHRLSEQSAATGIGHADVAGGLSCDVP